MWKPLAIPAIREIVVPTNQMYDEFTFNSVMIKNTILFSNSKDINMMYDFNSGFISILVLIV